MASEIHDPDMQTSGKAIGLAAQGKQFERLILLFLAGVVIRYLKPVLLPLTLSIILALILRPLHLALQRLHIHQVLSALLILGMLLGLTGGAISWLAPPAMRWLEGMPDNLLLVQDKIKEMMEPLAKLMRVAEVVDQAAVTENNALEVQLKEAWLSELAMKGVKNFIAYAALTFILLFLVLGYGDLLVKRAVQRHSAAGFIGNASSKISRYLATITIINTVLGAAIGTAMYILRMPNAALWGVMGGLLNFVPYIGAVMGTIVVSLVAILSFDSLTHIMLVPISYYILTATEGSIITPIILGKRFRINPLVLVVWLMIWGWFWGIVGALIAVPVLIVIKIICDYIPGLRSVSEAVGM